MCRLSCALIVRVQRLARQVRQGDTRAREAARSDALTRLPNRVALEERLPEILTGARERGESVAVLFIDVDRFKAIAALAQTLGIRVVAEGVETEAQRQFLCSLNCHYAQGYLFARPDTWESLYACLVSKAPSRVIALRGLL